MINCNTNIDNNKESKGTCFVIIPTSRGHLSEPFGQLKTKDKSRKTGANKNYMKLL